MGDRRFPVPARLGIMVSHPFARGGERMGHPVSYLKCFRKATAGPSTPFHFTSFRVRSLSMTAFLFVALIAMAGCGTQRRDRDTVVFLIQSSPANLDPRIGTDEPSEHIDELLFDGLVQRDASFHFTPGLAASWEQPDARTLIFHLRDGVK